MLETIKKFFKAKIKIKLPIYTVLITCFMLVVVYFIHILAKIIGKYSINQENLYWLFSASAQSIATFFAFLIAGYTLFVSMMDGLREKDDSLFDIVEEEKKLIFQKIKQLSIIVGSSLILNLSMIYANSIDFNIKADLIIVTLLTTAIAIIFGTWMVILIINPKKNKLIAAKLIYRQESFNQTGSKRNEQEFFSNFIKLEKELRDYIEKEQIIIKSRQPEVPTFREIVNHFYYTEMINTGIYNELLELNKYRNLLFHGHLNEASETMVDKIKNINKTILGSIKINNVKE